MKHLGWNSEEIPVQGMQYSKLESRLYSLENKKRFNKMLGICKMIDTYACLPVLGLIMNLKMDF